MHFVGSSRKIRSPSPLFARRWKPALSTADNSVVRGVIAPSALVQPVLVSCRRRSGGIFSGFDQDLRKGHTLQIVNWPVVKIHHRRGLPEPGAAGRTSCAVRVLLLA